ncbi:MAG: endonuclease III domain-containing protein [Candidatus Omnitrophota bacterium]
MKTAARTLIKIYKKLYGAFGPQRWWPGDTAFEVMIGAVLTQNTAWSNVEKAIRNLRSAGLLNQKKFAAVPVKRLALLIRPSGYYNMKAMRLKNAMTYIDRNFGGSLKKLFALETAELRKTLLGINGIGQETADSIILYAAEKPVFVVDAYTKRIFSRHRIIPGDASYEAVQKLFMSNLPKKTRLYNEYHALIVKLGKDFCKKSKPNCKACPLKSILPTDHHHARRVHAGRVDAGREGV